MDLVRVGDRFRWAFVTIVVLVEVTRKRDNRLCRSDVQAAKTHTWRVVQSPHLYIVIETTIKIWHHPLTFDFLSVHPQKSNL
jgi:hypothetical protein